MFSNLLGLSSGVQCGPFCLGSTKAFCFLCLFYNISNRNKIQQLNFQFLSQFLCLSMTTFHHIQQMSEFSPQTVTSTYQKLSLQGFASQDMVKLLEKCSISIGFESLHHWLPKIHLQNSLHATKTIHRFCYKELESKGTLY